MRQDNRKTAPIGDMVEAYLQLEGEPLTAREIAQDVADNAMAQGYFEGRKYEDVIEEILPEVRYYVSG